MTEHGVSRQGGRTQLPEEVASYVRELIISGAVRPGEFLRMEPIAEAVGVSNTPVREGLLALRSEGFVKLVPRRGFVVEPFTKGDVRDLFWAQGQLAGELAARAASRITPGQIGHLEQNLREYDAAIERGERDEIAALGHRFHRSINLAAQSPRLAMLLGSVVKGLPNTFYAAIEGQVEGTRSMHPLLLEALQAGKPTQARKVMRQHILEGGEALIGMLARRGLWDEREDDVPAVS